MSRVFKLNGTKIMRPRGRPRKFDEGEALDRAMKVFWARGFDGATVDDLVAGTGVGRPSLYATFGDKETLFMRCLEHYGRSVGALAVQALHTAPDVRGAICGFLKQAIESATGEGTPRGCLMACVVPSVNAAKVREFSARALAGMEGIIEKRLQDAVCAGELPPGFPCAARSRQVVGTSLALSLRARVGATREVLLADADDGVALILSATCVERLHD